MKSLLTIEYWPASKFVPYARNPRKNDHVVGRMVASIQEFGLKIPLLVRSNGEVVDGHLRLKAAQQLGLQDIPVLLCDEMSPAQVKQFRLLVNRSANWAEWNRELLTLELEELKHLEFSLDLTGFDPVELDDLLFRDQPGGQDDVIPEAPLNPVTKVGDVWVCGSHRVMCGDATSAEDVSRLLASKKPDLMVTDPPYGIDLDSEWRYRAGLNGKGADEPHYPRRTEGHRNTSISSDTRADWSEAFALVPSLQVAYVWHASKFTSEVLAGLLRIGFLHHQQIIWNKGRTVLTRTHYWFQHEPCWYVRKKNAPWFGKAGENSTVWESASPKFTMGGSKEAKFDHPTQKPLTLMRRPILNHIKRGHVVYDPFLGSGTTLIAADLVERVCYGLEIDPRYIDVTVARWQQLNGKAAVLDGNGCTFEQVRAERNLTPAEAH